MPHDDARTKVTHEAAAWFVDTVLLLIVDDARNEDRPGSRSDVEGSRGEGLYEELDRDLRARLVKLGLAPAPFDFQRVRDFAWERLSAIAHARRQSA